MFIYIFIYIYIYEDVKTSKKDLKRHYFGAFSAKKHFQLNYETHKKLD